MGSRQANAGRSTAVQTAVAEHPVRLIRPGPALVLLLLATLILLLFAKVPALLLNQQIAGCIAARQYENAENWLRWSERLLQQNAETTFLRARLLRKELALRDVPQLLLQARQQGFDQRLVQQEYLLLEAQAGHLPAVMDELNAMLTQDTSDGAEICEAYVNGAVMMGAVDLAENIISNWHQAYPADPQPHYAQARILEYQQRTAEALQELDFAVQKNPQHWPSVYARSRLAAAQGRVETALADAAAVSSGMQWNSAPLLQQARCLLDLAEPAKAKQLLEQIQARPVRELQHSFNLVCEPERGLPLETELGRAEAALGQPQAAVAWFDRVLKNDPRNLPVRYERAVCLQELGQNQKAEDEFQAVRQARERLREIDGLADIIREHPELPHVAERCRIGELFMLYEDARRGEFWLRDALNHDPEHQPAHRLLADYYDELAGHDPVWKTLADRHRSALTTP